MSFKKRVLSLLTALTLVFGTVGNLAVYAVGEDFHTHEHITSADTSDKEDPTTEHTHTWDSGTVTTKPTCGKPGIKTFKCTACEKTKTEEIPATEKHQWDEGKWKSPADCQVSGEKEFTCLVCQKTKTEMLKGDHRWSDWTVTAATCTKDGKKSRRCTVNKCTETETEIIKATGHDYKHIVDKSATCTENGKEYDKCTKCGDIKNEKTPPATGHDWKLVEEKKPTCTDWGYRRLECSACHEKKLEHDDVKDKPLGHSFGVWKITNPTCTQAGKKERTCSRCNGVEEEIIEATGHKVSDWQVKEEATCTKAGIKHKVCLICGKELESTNYELNPKGHTWSEWTVTKEPTYNTPGEKERRCTRKNCNAKETLRLPTIAKDHTHKFTEKTSVIKKPTCTENGLNRVYCSHKGCNEYEEIAVNSLGHAFDDWKTVQEADCINTGLRMSECSRCGATQSETTPPLGHQYGEWLITRESSDTESGIRQRTCEICGDIQIETFLGDPEESFNVTLPNGTHGVTLTAPNEQNISEEKRKSENIKKAVGVTVITVILTAVTAGAALLITKKKKN